MTALRSERPDDDLSRQRRKRDERLLATGLPDGEGVTIGDVVAEVVAAAATVGDRAAGAEFDVRAYLSRQGHSSKIIETVVDYLDRQDVGGMASPRPRRRR